MYLRATVQDGASRIHPQLLFFAAKVQISTSDSGPKWRFRTRQTAATFSLSMHKYVRFPFFQDGVSGVHEIDTIYKDGWSNFLSTENIKTPQNCCKLFAK
jgi:hypothetical protein